MNEKGWLIALLIFFTFFFTLNMGGYDLWPADEPRYAEVAREMMISGNYLTPHVNGERYQEKPPLLFWAMAAASIPFGEITEVSARIPSAASAVGTLFFVFLIARRWYGANVAIWAVIILGTNVRFWWQARTGQIDMLVTFCLMAALYALTRWNSARSISWLVLFYGAIAASALAKGPPPYLFPIFCVIAFYWRDKSARRGLHLILGSIAVWAIFFMWYAPAHMFAPAEEAARELTTAESIYRNTIGRLLGVSKADYPWAYLVSVPTDLLPWGLLLPWALPWAWRRRKTDEGTRLMLAWIVPAFIFFSLSIGKRAIYLMPLMPVFAILISASVAHLVVADRRRWRRNALTVWGVVLIILGIAPFAVPFTEYARFWNGGIAFFGVACLASGLASVVYARTSDGVALPRYYAATFAIMASLAATFVLPTINMEKGAKAFCAPVREAAQAGDINVYSLAFSREEYILYSEHFHEPLFTDVIIDDSNRDKDPMKVGMIQRAAQNDIGDAVEEVDIADFGDLSDEEILQLKAAVDALVNTRGFEAGNVRSVRKTLESALKDLDAEFASSTPTFAYVQTKDWRWMLALRPALRLYPVIAHRPVGSRDMLLIGNAAAQ